jgi:hypothetical protein
MTFTGTISPTGAAGTYKWVITGAAPNQYTVTGAIEGTITAGNPITPTIVFHALNSAAQITITFGFTPTNGAPTTAPPYSAPAIDTTFTVPTSTGEITGTFKVERVATAEGITYTRTSGVTISVKGTASISSTPTVAAYINEWELGYIQNVISSTVVITYTNTIKTQTLNVLPALDSGTANNPVANSQPFSVNNPTATISRTDTPSVWVDWDDPRTGARNTLEEYYSYKEIVTWLVARNKRTGEIRYLKYWHSIIVHHVKYDTTKPPSQRTAIPVPPFGGIMDPPPEGTDGPGPYPRTLTPPRANEQVNTGNVNITIRARTP